MELRANIPPPGQKYSLKILVISDACLQWMSYPYDSAFHLFIGCAFVAIAIRLAHIVAVTPFKVESAELLRRFHR